jgi:hypothetical protein
LTTLISAHIVVFLNINRSLFALACKNKQIGEAMRGFGEYKRAYSDLCKFMREHRESLIVEVMAQSPRKATAADMIIDKMIDMLADPFGPLDGACEPDSPRPVVIDGRMEAVSSQLDTLLKSYPALKDRPLVRTLVSKVKAAASLEMKSGIAAAAKILASSRYYSTSTSQNHCPRLLKILQQVLDQSRVQGVSESLIVARATTQGRGNDDAKLMIAGIYMALRASRPTRSLGDKATQDYVIQATRSMPQEFQYPEWSILTSLDFKRVNTKTKDMRDFIALCTRHPAMMLEICKHPHPAATDLKNIILNSCTTAPDCLKCALSHEVMSDPVKIKQSTSDQYYEKDAITTWFARSNNDPTTNVMLNDKTLLPDTGIQQACLIWTAMHPEAGSKDAAVARPGVS